MVVLAGGGGSGDDDSSDPLAATAVDAATGDDEGDTMAWIKMLFLLGPKLKLQIDQSNTAFRYSLDCVAPEKGKPSSIVDKVLL